MNRIDLPSDKDLAGKVLEAHAREAQRQRGLMGWIIGAGAEKPGNLVGFATIISCAMVFFLSYASLQADVPRRELIMLFAAIVPGALGYYFGYLTGGKSSDKD